MSEPHASRRLRRLVFALPFFAFFAFGVSQIHRTVTMPGTSFRGTPPPETEEGRALRRRLEGDVTMLADVIGERNVGRPAALEQARSYVADRFAAAGLTPALESFEAAGMEVSNVVVELRGARAPDEVVVFGAHYDSARRTPGADDNASGVAALLSLAERALARPRGRTVRFVAFVNEEPPFFQGPLMGSVVNAQRARSRGDRIAGMVSLEMLGCFSDVERSQRYPFPLSLAYPTTGNFIAFVSDRSSREWLHLAIGAFRSSARIASEGAALPATTTGVGWSDHWAFWQAGYPALMVTDTSLFRYPEYHSPRDSPERLDFARMARVVEGLDALVEEVAR